MGQLCVLITGWTTGRSGFDSRQGQRIFPLTSVSRPALGSTQPPVKWISGVLSPGVKARPGRDADHSPPSSAEVVNEEIYLLSPQTPPWRVAGLLYLYLFFTPWTQEVRCNQRVLYACCLPSSESTSELWWINKVRVIFFMPLPLRNLRTECHLTGTNIKITSTVTS
jgi:hypothetical protein